MTIIGFNFTSINVEKKGTAKGKISINNNVVMKDVIETSVAVGKSKQKGIIFKFEFITEYKPDLGHITLRGDVVDLQDDKTIKDVMASWKKNKTVTKDVMTNILNSILNKCNIEAMLLSKEVNLPSPIKLPKAVVKQ